MDDYNQIKQNFLEELKNASSNKESSLSFIKNHLSSKPLVTTGIVQAIVIGGTNYISSLAKLGPSHKSIFIQTKTGILPVFKSKLSFSTFLNGILNPNAEVLGLNFAFPLEPVIGSNGQLDGILLGGTKEHTFDGLIGKQIGEFVSDIFFSKYQTRIPVTVANDTVCLTLAGNGSEKAGMIVGTGFNMSLKINGDFGKSVVNLEAGNFDKFTAWETLQIIDSQSEYKGKMMFEKAISGRYLVEHFNEEVRNAEKNIPLLNTSKNLSLLAETDQTGAGQLAREILERSANMVASVVDSAYEFSNKPAKMEFITEGSMFWKGYKYLENVEKMLVKLGVPQDTIKFKYVEDSSLKGALGLLTN